MKQDENEFFVCPYSGIRYNRNDMSEEEVHVFHKDKDGYIVFGEYDEEWWSVKSAEEHATKYHKRNGDTCYFYIKDNK